MTNHKFSKSAAIVTMITTIALLAFDVITPEFEITQMQFNIIVTLIGSFGVGGIYVKAIKEGFAKFKDYKNPPE